MDEYRLHIEGYTLKSMPMLRLARVMSDLATLMGSTEAVHFDSVDPGSVWVTASVDPVAATEVRSRVHAVSRGRGPQEAIVARDRIDKHLREHGKSGRLYWAHNDELEELIAFAGEAKQRVERIGPIRELGSLQGQLVKIGGKDETVWVILRDGDTFISHIHTRDHALARSMGQHLLDETIRLTGYGRWLRNEDGVWELEDFHVDQFEVLDDRTLNDLREKLRDAPRSDWAALDDPHGQVLRNRHGQDDTR